MAQTTQIIQALKQALKAHGKTYVDVANVLGLTEASVKRLFAEQNITLERLDAICQMLGIEISDLLGKLAAQDHRLQELSQEQEQQLCAELPLLLVTVCVLNRWTLDNIVSHFQIDELQCLRYLARLDRMKLIELLPKNRIKLLVAPNFGWRTNGPIQQFFQQRLAMDYFTSRFTDADESLLVLNGMLTHASNQEFQRKMQRLVREFDELNLEDTRQPFEARQGYTVIVALRRWGFGLFRPLIRT